MSQADGTINVTDEQKEKQGDWSRKKAKGIKLRIERPRLARGGQLCIGLYRLH